MSDPSEGHPECVMDFGDVTDDGEVQLRRGRPGSTGGDHFGSVRKNGIGWSP